MRDDDGTMRRLGDQALATGEASAPLRGQLRSHVLAEQISTEGTAAYTYDPAALRRGLSLARLGQLARTPRERRTAPGPLPDIAQAYADLAAQANEPETRIELLAISATMWSLAGYQANATAIARTFQREVGELFTYREFPSPDGLTAAAPYRIAEAAGAILQRDIDTVAQLGAATASELPHLGRALTVALAAGQAEQADLAVLAAYGLVGRSARSLATLWRTGDRTAGRTAISDLKQAATILLQASVVDTWTLVDSLAHAVEDIVATSPWLLLRRASSWSRIWERYLKALIVSDRPLTQVWPSQRTALDAGLLDARAHNLTVTMPTSAGKTHIAEWAILHALAHTGETDDSPLGLILRFLDPPLAVYVVPTRALAAQVERHLAASLELVGLRVSSLFGGAEHVRYENQLLDHTDVLVVTTEKLDLLLRNTPELAGRLRLVLVDEGHSIDQSARGLRLEMVLTRIRRTTPQARIVLLSAVLPNGEDIARWLEPTADGTNHAKIDWSPSQLRTGVFSWQGQEKDGQTGSIHYGTAQGRDFFVPKVLTRRLTRTRLFPRDLKDVAAALALHFERLGPVLISTTQPAYAQSAARALQTALNKTDTPVLGAPNQRDQRRALSERIAEHLGEEHALTVMVTQGIAYHHGTVPQPVRHLLERAYRDGVLRLLCATSTLSQGMNLPVKTVLVHSTWRNQEQIGVREFWNAAGRAGRAFQETEGHVVLIAKDTQDARNLRRRYLDKDNIEPVVSTIGALYYRLAITRLGALPIPGQNLTDIDLPDPELEDLTDWAQELELQLLTMLAEEVVDTPDQHLLEDAAHDLLAHTLGGHQIGTQEWSLKPLARFTARRVAALARQLPDPAARAAILRTGLSLQGGIDAITAAEQVANTLTEHPGLLDPATWPALRDTVLTAATTIQELRRSATDKNRPIGAVVPLAGDWIAGWTLQEIHHHYQLLLAAKDITATSDYIDKVITHDLAWAVSSILPILETRHGITLEGPLATLPAMLKYGVDTAPACYAASLGIHQRSAATGLAARCPVPEPSFSDFTRWLADLTTDEITAITTPSIAALLIRSTERRSPRSVQKTIVSGRGTFTTPLRGVRHANNLWLLASLPAGTRLDLVRDPNNPADPNAIRVEHSGLPLGWIAKSTARPLALALDDRPAPLVTATLHTDPQPLADTGQLTDHDQVELAITISPAPEDRRRRTSR
ncbi:Superfamily II helicase [Streptomyces sp. ScaeMP-e48]|uniref:DEAD/DEAH box helicase n=1 Tax=Streptomyces sp. ScaeMP-e48 TaxID=1100823 RepID=UPI00082391AE|nr:DEAD/DEAH box helicase [Streptomyces sp. ScaeMP-e48]SCK55991.1 Superfamily II helicase [Streptomyces sp. ScaeMP-e48]